MNFSKETLRQLPTINQGHTDDLKIETKDLRVWLSRVDNSVTIEQLIDGKWEIVGEQW